jgi:hypothetical protein
MRQKPLLTEMAGYQALNEFQAENTIIDAADISLCRIAFAI